MKVEDICKIVPCATCSGEGVLRRYPHYSNPMPEQVEEQCHECSGRKEVVLVATGVIIVRDSSFKAAGF